LYSPNKERVAESIHYALHAVPLGGCGKRVGREKLHF